MLPSPELDNVVEFYWQTNYSGDRHFSVKTFPRVGSTLLFNLGTAFTFHKGGSRFLVDENVFYPRDQTITTSHSIRNHLFGVQLKINLPSLLIGQTSKPVMQAKSFVPATVAASIKEAREFEERVSIVDKLLLNMLSDKMVFKTRIISGMINHFTLNMEKKFTSKDWMELTCCSPKSVERYFNECCAITPKQAMKTIRIREAANQFINRTNTFDCHAFGYYDHSHFYKDYHDFMRG